MNGFDPLGGFNPSAPLLQAAIDASRAIMPSFPDLQGLLRRIYYHWAVMPFGCLDGAYNGEVDLENLLWVMKITHGFADNMPGLNNNAMASHTWERNTGALGIAITGMDGATTTDFGPDGVQLHELEFICAFGAAVCAKYGLDALGTVSAPGETHPSSNDSGNVPGPINTTGENVIETHATCALFDDYRGERWDFGSLTALPPGVSLTDAMRVASANAMRFRTHLYKIAIAA